MLTVYLFYTDKRYKWWQIFYTHTRNNKQNVRRIKRFTPLSIFRTDIISARTFLIYGQDGIQWQWCVYRGWKMHIRKENISKTIKTYTVLQLHRVYIRFILKHSLFPVGYDPYYWSLLLSIKHDMYNYFLWLSCDQCAPESSGVNKIKLLRCKKK